MDLFQMLGIGLPAPSPLATPDDTADATPQLPMPGLGRPSHVELLALPLTPADMQAAFPLIPSDPFLARLTDIVRRGFDEFALALKWYLVAVMMFDGNFIKKKHDADAARAARLRTGAPPPPAKRPYTFKTLGLVYDPVTDTSTWGKNPG